MSHRDGDVFDLVADLYEEFVTAGGNPNFDPIEDWATTDLERDFAESVYRVQGGAGRPAPQHMIDMAYSVIGLHRPQRPVV